MLRTTAIVLGLVAVVLGGFFVVRSILKRVAPPPVRPFTVYPAPPPKHKLHIAAAASLRPVLPEMVDAFEKAHSMTSEMEVEVTYGSSGNLFAQIQNKAPFDVLLSADEDYPQKLIDIGHGVHYTLTRYATGRVVLWVAKDSPLDVSQGYAALDNEALKKLAIANPKLAPYGAAAEAALQKAGKYDALKDKLVLGENITQTAQFVESGAAQAGFIALSLAVSPEMKDKGRYWLVPEADHAPIAQAAVAVTHTTNLEDARSFLEFLRSPAATETLKRYGFGIPGE